MDRRQLLKILGISTAWGIFSGPLTFGQIKQVKQGQGKINTPQSPVADYTAYLMAYFKSDNQQLFYAVSHDCREWTALNGGQPVLKTTVNLRDPFIGRANGQFHLVHTKGWDYPVIYHYSSDDLVDWQGGPIQVVPEERKRAWAPEWFYEEKEGLFYVFWASLHNGHNTIFYTKTKDWKDIRPENAKIYYDLGMDDIDFTVIKAGDESGLGYIGFHKPGSLEDNFSVRCFYSPTLNPDEADFAFGKKEHNAVALPDMIKPIEGPEMIKINGAEKWYVYADPFHHSFIAWETTDFKHFERTQVHVPGGSKHCSIMAITQGELQLLKKKFPI